MKRGSNFFSKRALSTIVSTLLILLLVFVAIGIVWVVVRNVIQEGSEQISLGKYTLDLAIERVEILEGNNFSIGIKRNAGPGEFVGVHVIASDGRNSETFVIEESLQEHQRKFYTFNIKDFDISDLEKIDIAPVFRLESGKETLGDPKDTWYAGSSRRVSAPDDSLVGGSCVYDSDCTDDYYDSDYYCSGNSVNRTLYDFECNASGQCSFDTIEEEFENCTDSGQFCDDGSCVSSQSGSVQIVNVSASSYDTFGPYLPEYTLDDDLGDESRWSAEGDGEWIEFELSETATVDEIRIAFYNGDSRTASFSVETSVDGSAWNEVLAETSSSGSSTILESFSLQSSDVKYVKIVGHGNTDNNWNSYTEVKIENFDVNLTDDETVTCGPDDGKCPSGTSCTESDDVDCPECYSNVDCSSGEICSSGSCVLDSGESCTDDDGKCPSGIGCYIDNDNDCPNECLSDGTGCQSGQSCVGGSCVDSSDVNYMIPTYPSARDFSNVVYIDPSSSTNGVGSMNDPKNTLSGLSMQSDTAYLIKAGTTIDNNIQLSTSNIYVGMYGEGEKPIILGGMGVSNSDITIENIHLQKYGNGNYDNMIDIKKGETNVVFAHCIIQGLDNGNGYPHRNIVGGGPNTVFYHNEISYSKDDGMYLSGQPGYVIVSNYMHHNNMGGVDSTNSAGDGIQIEYGLDHGDMYMANNYIDRSHTIWKFALILKDNGIQENAVAEWNTFIGPRDGNGGATVWWNGGTNNKFRKNLVITPYPISAIATTDFDANQEGEYGIKDNHLVGHNGIFGTSIDQSNLKFDSEADYDSYLLENNLQPYGSDIDPNNFWGS